MNENMHTEIKCDNLNEFGFIDYKKPLDKQQDMRTATYVGHKHMTDTMLGNKIHVKFKETLPYIEDATLAKHRTSSYKAKFVWKFNNPDEIRNPSLDKNINYIKPFYDSNLKFIKRPMVPASSVSHSDYLWHSKPPTMLSASLSMPAPVASTQILIDRNKPGYSKYLDPAATTTRLDYCYRSPKDVMSGISAKDNITFWNWKDTEYRSKKVFREKDRELCDKLPSNECTKRRCEFPSKVKPVPNTGLTTEVRDNYMEPYKRPIDYDVTNIRNDFTFVTIDPPTDKTEYDILGSGECTQKYV